MIINDKTHSEQRQNSIHEWMNEMHWGKRWHKLDLWPRWRSQMCVCDVSSVCFSNWVINNDGQVENEINQAQAKKNKLKNGNKQNIWHSTHRLQNLIWDLQSGTLWQFLLIQAVLQTAFGFRWLYNGCVKFTRMFWIQYKLSFT